MFKVVVRLLVNIFWPQMAITWAKQIEHGQMTANVPAKYFLGLGYVGYATLVVLIACFVFKVQFFTESLLITYVMERVALVCFANQESGGDRHGL